MGRLSPMAEPTSIVAVVKTTGEAVAALWERGAILLWCLTTLCAAIFVALVIGAHWGLGDTPALLASYGTGLALSVIALAVFAGFKTYAESTAAPLVLVPDEQQSWWSQSTQPSGEIFTSIVLRFQATNVSDRTIKISSRPYLRWPWVRRHRIIQSNVIIRHPTDEIYSSEYPIPAHSLTHGQVAITINRPVGTKEKPRRVVVSIDDHVRRRYTLIFAYVRST
jgi:hypothetical protein